MIDNDDVGRVFDAIAEEGPDGDEEFPVEAPRRKKRPQPPDPAYTGARLMLLAAIPNRRLRDRLGGEAIAAVVQVWNREWLDPIAMAWRMEIRGREREEDGERASGANNLGPWVQFIRDGSRKNHTLDGGNDVVAASVWRNRAIVGFATEPVRYLPRSLTKIAEHHFVVGPMDVGVFRKVVRSMTGKSPPADVPPGLLARLTPDILRLAWRPGVKPDAYVARLAELAVRPDPTADADGPTLDDLHGMDEAVAWAKATVRDFDDYRAKRIGWKDMNRGLLIYGPPGVGKTMFASAFAKSAGLPLIATSFAEWQSSGTGHLGDTLKAMRDDFADAKAEAPSVLFIDELDAIGDRAATHPHHRDYWTACVTGFLEQLDGIAGREGVLVIGATNNPTVIDPAVLRAGRMDHMVQIGLPDPMAIAGILRVHLGADLTGEDLSRAAQQGFGGSGADCAKWVRMARQRARHHGRPLEMADLLAAIGTSRVSPATDRRMAIHEAAHAVATTVLRPGKVLHVRIGNGASTAGNVSVEAAIENSRQGIRTKIIELLAGRAAEEFLLGEPSGGCGGSADSDLAVATCLAVTMDTALGLGQSGLVWMGSVNPNSVGPMLSGDPALAERVSNLLDELYAEATHLVNRYLEAIGVTADTLLLRRALSGQEVAKIVAKHPPIDKVMEGWR